MLCGLRGHRVGCEDKTPKQNPLKLTYGLSVVNDPKNFNVTINFILQTGDGSRDFSITILSL